MLNLSKQLPHQLNVFGDYSQMISDFVEVNLPEALQTVLRFWSSSAISQQNSVIITKHLRRG